MMSIKFNGQKNILHAS